MNELEIIKVYLLYESLYSWINRNDIPSYLGIVRVLDSSEMKEFGAYPSQSAENYCDNNDVAQYLFIFSVHIDVIYLLR